MKDRKVVYKDPQPTSITNGSSKLQSKPIPQNRATQELLSICNRKVEDLLGNLLARFHEAIESSLFDAAKQATDITEQNAFFAALKIINTKKDAARTSFCRRVGEDLRKYSPGSAEYIQKQKRESANDHLAIVEDKFLDIWLADKTTTSSIEAHFRAPLADLTQRLSVVFGVEINNENNPYGPALFTRSFTETIKSLGTSHEANLCCYQVFKEALLKELAGLYAALNELLIANGILPVITHKVEKRPIAAASNNNTATAALPNHATESADAGETQNSLKPAGTSPAKPQDIIELMGRLYSLQRNLANLSVPQTASDPGEVSAEGAVSPGASTGNAINSPKKEVLNYSSKELIGALARLAVAESAPGELQQTRDYKSEVLKLMAGGLHPDMSRTIGVHESSVMDLASNIFHSIEKDDHLSGKVRGWIRRMELPVLKLALLDDSLFVDKSHPIRQVVNKLSQLEIVEGEAGQSNEQAIRSAIEWIIDLLNSNVDGSMEALPKAVRAIDILLDGQKKTYFGNVRKVIAQAKQQEQSKKLGLENVESQAGIHWSGISEYQRASWLRRVKRLSTGDWLVLDAESANPQRLRIAWISDDIQKYFLVDLNGREAMEMHAEELAKAFHDRRITPLEGVDEPAMDRAQYAMLQDLHSKLMDQSTHDQLTGLISRRAFEKHLSDAHLSAREENSHHTVCFINLDQFSLINNACGYEGGDKVLKEVSYLLDRRLDDKSVLARLGSDEFGLLLRNHKTEDAVLFIEQQLKEIKDYRLDWNNKRLSIGVSIGLVPLTPDTENVSGLLREAESGCRIAKEMGGNRVHVVNSEDECLSKSNDAFKWAVEIDRILDEETMYLRCQKILPISGSTTERSHFEVLLGVWDSTGGEISTPVFIEAAERYRRMPDVDKWIIKNTFRWIASNQSKLQDIDSFSINLSGRSLNDDSFMQFIKEEMETTGVPRDKLCFEVTETVGVASLSDAAAFIQEFKKIGCKFSLDDFGTGMSSYAYLRNLPVDYLKVDGVFVKDMARNPCDFAVVKSICEIGHYMGKKVIAEYVENDTILEQLRDIGMDFAQGYGVGKPIPLNKLLDLASEDCP